MNDLTDKWKKSELPEGMYYVENNNGIISMIYLSEIASLVTGWPDIKEVKDKVPTYEEYINLQRRWIEERAENGKLKEQQKSLEDNCKILAQKLLQVKPELREWLEVNFKEYL